MSFTTTIIEQNPVQMSLEEAIALVEENADQEWMSAAMYHVRVLCGHHSEFTTDDVWARLQHVETKEHRAMGAVMRKAAKAGWCVPTERFVKSQRPECNRRPICVWQSRLLPVNY